jgi:hypothetical protein
MRIPSQSPAIAYKLSEVMEVYELIIPSLKKDKKQKFREFIAQQVLIDGMVTHRDDKGDLIAAAFFWHVSDPYDVVDKSGFPGQDPNGKYLYFPICYVHPDNRQAPKIIKALLKKAFKIVPTASRAVWQRDPPRDSRVMHILNGDKFKES